MYKLDLSLFDRNGSRIFRFDNQQVEFYKKVTVQEPIYTTRMNGLDEIDFLTEKQVKDLSFDDY
jgi:hypothetical protein